MDLRDANDKRKSTFCELIGPGGSVHDGTTHIGIYLSYGMVLPSYRQVIMEIRLPCLLPAPPFPTTRPVLYPHNPSNSLWIQEVTNPYPHASTVVYTSHPRLHQRAVAPRTLFLLFSSTIFYPPCA